MSSKSIFSYGLSVFVRSIFASFMCLIMTMSITVISFNWIAQLIIQIFSLILFCTIPYSGIWDLGSSDKNKVAYHHIEEDKLKGFKIGLIATIPCFLTYLGLIVCKLFDVNLYLALFRIINPHFLVIFNYLLPPDGGMTQLSWLNILCVLPLSMLLPLVCLSAYWLGYKRISIIEKIIYKNGRKPKRRRRK